jgi:hypothetical protein
MVFGLVSSNGGGSYQPVVMAVIWWVGCGAIGIEKEIGGGMTSFPEGL